MTLQQAHDNKAAAMDLLRETFSPADERFLEQQYDLIFGDDAGTFEQKYTEEDREQEIDWRAIQADLTLEYPKWEKAIAEAANA